MKEESKGIPSYTSKTQDLNQSATKTRMGSIIKQNGENFMKNELQ
jgi:hypothetical protein